MMRLLPVLLAASLIAAPALARKHTTHAVSEVGDSCTAPDDRTAFDVEGLKSELMVTALACKQQDKYNAFMRTYQPAVASEEADLHAYFKRAYGRASTKAYDDYISNLANVQEQDGLKAGTAFCDNLPNMFDEVMSLHSAAELPDYAKSQPLVQPVDFVQCSATSVKATTPTRHHSSRRTKHT